MHRRINTLTHRHGHTHGHEHTLAKTYPLPPFLCLQSFPVLTWPCTTHFSLGPGVPSSLSGTQPGGARCPATPRPSVPCMFFGPWDYAQSCLSAVLSPGSPLPLATLPLLGLGWGLSGRLVGRLKHGHLPQQLVESHKGKESQKPPVTLASSRLCSSATIFQEGFFWRMLRGNSSPRAPA